MEDKPSITDDFGTPLSVGMRVGCRQKGEPRSFSIRALTLLGFEPGHDTPYITDRGRFAHAVKDHQPEMDEFIANHVR